jgi:hypothetical protein
VGDARKQPRPLSHDEAKAAEAAFQGRPFNEDWSESARTIYDGLMDAMRKRSGMWSDVPLLDDRSHDGETELDYVTSYGETE